MAKVQRPPFRADREFKIARAFVYNGKRLAMGRRFEKGGCPERLLRQLYDQRKLEELPA